MFQAAGSGLFYLPAGSPYLDAGTTNINPGLLADLRKRTTSAPLSISNVISGDTTLAPVTAGDSGPIDLGYHYDLIDFLIQNLSISNAVLTLTNGVCLGVVSNSPVGIRLDAGARLTSRSGPTALNRLFRVDAVQEQASPSAGTLTLLQNNNALATNDFRFTDLPVLAGSGRIFDTNSVGGFSLVDSQLRGGAVRSDGSLSVMSTNTLFERVNIALDSTNGPMHCGVYGCLVRGGPQMELNNRWSGSSLEIFNTLFESVSNITYQSSLGSTNAFNGYYATSLLPNSVGEVVLTTLTWQTGVFGPYYQPTNSLLIDRGTNTAASWGYYHYTVATNNVKETNSVIDIGLHFIATDANGTPLDYDGDGVPDWQENWHGDGSVDSGETDWRNANDPGLKVYITRPKAGGNLP